MSSSILVQLQGACAAELSADPYFSNIQVVTQAIQDLGSVIDQALASLGVCALVIVPTADIEHPNQQGPYFEDIKIIVRVIESVTVNQNTAAGGTGKGALAVAEYVCAVLHQFAPPNITELVYCDKPTIVLVADPERLIYDVCFKSAGGLSYAISQLDTPSFTQTGESISISAPASGGNPVAGAVVYYTTNGTFPAPQNGTVYSGPISVTPGTVLKARAWMYGYEPSALVSTTAT